MRLKAIAITAASIASLLLISFVGVSIVEKPVYNYSNLEYYSSSNTFRIFVNYNWGFDRTIDLPPNITIEQAQYMYEQFLKNK